jgi:hypothetical protein
MLSVLIASHATSISLLSVLIASHATSISLLSLPVDFLLAVEALPSGLVACFVLEQQPMCGIGREG